VTPVVPGTSGATVRTSLDDGVLVVQLNRPEAAHARNQVMRGELTELWRATAEDRAVRAVVLTGSGHRFFCAGMDLKEAAEPESRAARRERLLRGGDIELLAELPQPTIAAINGFALGGGLEMALACDIRIIADSAQVAMPEVSRGLVPAAGGTSRLPQVIGYARAFEMILSGRRIDAQQAAEWGLASQAADPETLAAEAEQLARSFAAHPDQAVRAGKALLRRNPRRIAREAEIDALLALLDDANLATGR
jgi:methylglutaconyl-CoA hydratase